MKEFVLFFITSKVSIFDVPAIAYAVHLATENKWLHAFGFICLWVFIEGFIKVVLS